MKNDLMQCDKKNTSQETGNKGIKHQDSWNSVIKNAEVSQKEKDKYCMISILYDT